MVTYLDHAADTPVRPEALEAMLPWLSGAAGNPTGAHGPARRARRAVDDAREAVAALVGAEPAEVVFTSGGTEADDLAVHGVADATGATVACSAVEHPAVLAPVRRRGGRVLAVDAHGRVDLDALADGLDPATGLVSVLLANNETGVVQPLDRVADVVTARAPGAHLHTDAVQAAPWLDLPVLAARADLVSLSGHKLGGPSGVGALVVRRGTPLAARVMGGGQELDRRAGSHHVAGIVGLGAAAAVLVGQRSATSGRVGALAERLRVGLSSMAGVALTVPDDVERLPNVVHVMADGVVGEEVVFLLDQRGIAASAGSSCASGALTPSPVLAAMGLADGRARGALRLSLGWCSTDADVDAVLAVLPEVLAQLRVGDPGRDEPATLPVAGGRR